MVLKDLIDLSPLVLKAPNSTKGLSKENNGILRFVDKNGKPISKIKIEAGETIGYTAKWDGEKNKAGVGMHFTIAKFQFIQQYRDFLVVKPFKTLSQVQEIYQNYLLVPCSLESPVRCK